MDENLSGAFDHEEYVYSIEHEKEMNDLNRRMVEEFDRILAKREYKFVTAEHKSDLEEKVNNFIKQGWIAFGSASEVVTDSGYLWFYQQVMINNMKGEIK